MAAPTPREYALLVDEVFSDAQAQRLRKALVEAYKFAYEKNTGTCASATAAIQQLHKDAEAALKRLLDTPDRFNAL